MVGICSYGVYIPRYRISGEELARAWGGRGGNERSVANYDEDAITMATEAVLTCLESVERGMVDGLYFASSSAPYAEKQNATTVAAAADLGKEIFVGDFAGSLRAGTSALRAAVDSVKAGSAENVLVTASDLRVMSPGSPEEKGIGDGAGALLIGDKEVIAEIESIYSFSEEFFDVWKKSEHAFPSTGDPQFVKQYGYQRVIRESFEGLLKQTGLNKDEISTVCFYAPDQRTSKDINKLLKLSPEACLDDLLLGTVGNCGNTYPFLLLMKVLDTARPGDRIVLMSYGNGSDAILFKVTEGIEAYQKKGQVNAEVEWKRPLGNYEKYLKFRGLLPAERISPFTSLPVLWREEKGNIRLYAKKCEGCGAIQYPARRICWKCSTKDNFTDTRLSRRGRIITFTKDHLIPSPDLPVIMVSADMEGGGRFYTQLVDCDPGEVEVGMDVQLTFRKIHEGEGLNNYFWKFRPVNNRQD